MKRGTGEFGADHSPLHETLFFPEEQPQKRTDIFDNLFSHVRLALFSVSCVNSFFCCLNCCTRRHKFKHCIIASQQCLVFQTDQLLMPLAGVYQCVERQKRKEEQDYHEHDFACHHPKWLTKNEIDVLKNSVHAS